MVIITFKYYKILNICNIYATLPGWFLFAPLGSRRKQSISLQVWFSFEVLRHAILKVKSTWDLLNPFIFQLSPAPPLLTPVSTSRYGYLVFLEGLHLSPTCPGIAPVLLMQWKEQVNWISTRRKKATLPAGALRYLLVGADKHIPIVHIIREQMHVAACT